MVKLERPDGMAFSSMVHLDSTLSENSYQCLERHIKFILWQQGGSRITSNAPKEFIKRLSDEYEHGRRGFDSDIIGKKVFGESIAVQALQSDLNDIGEPPAGLAVGGFNQGCRIGFDLGGSDRKCAAVMDGKVLFSEEIPWDPYFEKDPEYHWKGIVDSIDRAAVYLPRIDAIGGSAAGIYINNEPKVGSLFRGINSHDFDEHIRPLFKRLSKHYGNVPVHVVNDGDATALSASQSRGVTGVLGIAMGTSMAVGYVDGRGSLTPWLNELAFAPVDYSPEAPIDEWSGDRGCGAQYFSQQAVGRLLGYTDLSIDPDLPLPELLKAVQSAMEEGKPGAQKIFRTIGIYLAYGVLHYKQYYDFHHLLLLGRVMSGSGGDLIRETAGDQLRELDPELAKDFKFLEPTEREKRHGQAIAAASLIPDEMIGKETPYKH